MTICRSILSKIQHSGRLLSIMAVLAVSVGMAGSLTSCKAGKPTYSRAPANFDRTPRPYIPRIRKFPMTVAPAETINSEASRG